MNSFEMNSLTTARKDENTDFPLYATNVDEMQINIKIKKCDHLL